MGHSQYLFFLAPSHQILKSLLSFYRFWYISKCYRFFKSVLSFSKPQLNFQKIKISRILLSINLNVGCSSYVTMGPINHLYIIYIHLYSFIFIYIHLYSFIFIYIHLYSCIFIYIYLYSFIFVYIHLYSFIFIYIHLYSFIFIYISLYSFM